jgi:orotate phosphoribosyltransferase
MSATISEQVELGLRRLVSLQLWQLGAIKVNLTDPFKLASGNYSPIYVNCRQLISAPAFADLFAAASRIVCEQRTVEFDVVAGGETAGIPFAAFLARSLGRPLIYVRKATKAYGTASRIEGSLSSNVRTLLVEDLITDAGSKLSFIKAIREAGSEVKDALVVFDRMQGGSEALDKEGIRLHALTDMDTALAVAQDVGVLSSDDLGSVQEYLGDAPAWHKARGLQYHASS